jgi:hypothetical protein
MMGVPAIRIIGPNRANVFIVEFQNGHGESLSLFIPASEGGHVLSHIQERIPYGLKLHDPADVAV